MYLCGMDIESIREYCLSLPMASEDMAFGDECLLFRVCNKIFACYTFAGNNNLVFKADPDYSLDLRDRYPEIEPAWHWNKRYWNQVRLQNNLSSEFIKSLIRHSYSEVVKKLPKKVKTEYPQILEINTSI